MTTKHWLPNWQLLLQFGPQFFLLAMATKHSQLEMLCAHRQLSQIWIGSLENCQ